MLLLASIFLIHSTHGLVTKMVYSFVRTSSIFRNHPHHCICKSFDITMILHLLAIPPSPELLNWLLEITGFQASILSPRSMLTPAIHANKKRLYNIHVIVNWLHFPSLMLPGRVYPPISSPTCLFQMARILFWYLLMEWSRWLTSYSVSNLLQLLNLLNYLFLTLSDFTVFPI